MDGMQNVPDEIRQYIQQLEEENRFLKEAVHQLEQQLHRLHERITQLEKRLKIHEILIHHHPSNDSKETLLETPTNQENVAPHQVIVAPPAQYQNLTRSSPSR